jgi:hypothetical protein
MIISKDAKAIYAQHGIQLDDVDAVLVAHNCNTQAINSGKTAEDWAHVWAAAESFTETEVTYEELSRGH